MNPAYDSRSFELTDVVFDGFRKLTLEQTGISLDETKRAMIMTRFSRRVRALGLNSFEEYLEVLSQSTHPERIEFIDTITTNLTYFFREPHHFEQLGQVIIPRLQSEQNSRKPIRIWSAGCSSGQEPYSIAMTALEAEHTGRRPVRILCTDIDSKMVGQTQRGRYKPTELRGMSPEQTQLWFARQSDGMLQAKDELVSMMVCKYMNLFGPWPIRQGVDVIFCRNVLIYFDVERQEKVVRGMAKLQDPGSTLFLGHSETISQCSDVYRRISNTVYERL